MLLGGLGVDELVLMAAVALLMGAVGRLMGLQRARSTEQSHSRVDGAPYLDRLLGSVRASGSAAELPTTRVAD